MSLVSISTSKIFASVTIAIIDASGSGKKGWHSAYKTSAGMFVFLKTEIMAASVPKIEPFKNLKFDCHIVNHPTWNVLPIHKFLDCPFSG